MQRFKKQDNDNSGKQIRFNNSKRKNALRGAVYGDKGNSPKEVSELLEQQGCHNATKKKKNIKGKNQELDKWHRKLRSPYEREFSKMRKRTRNVGKLKNGLSQLFNAKVHKAKRLLKIAPDLSLSYEKRDKYALE